MCPPPNVIVPFSLTPHIASHPTWIFIPWATMQIENLCLVQVFRCSIQGMSLESGSRSATIHPKTNTMKPPTVFNHSLLPKVGIRPAIDGRLGGVRESLEKQTMDQAKAAAKLISSALRYPNGQPVDCVIADTCIGGVAEAAACAEKFAKAGAGLSLTVTPCWCYGSETMDMAPVIPKAVWGFNGTERSGCRLSCGRVGRAFAEGRSGVQHLRS